MDYLRLTRFLFLLLFTSTLVAHADDEAPLDPDKLWRQAIEQAKAGKHEAAIESLRQSYDLAPKARTLAAIASELEALGRTVEAANTFAEYLERDDAGARESVEQRLAELDKQVGRLHIDIRVPGTQVRLDDESLGPSPVTVLRRVAPGSHTVTVEAGVEYKKALPTNVTIGSMEEVVLEDSIPEPRIKDAETSATVTSSSPPSGTILDSIPRRTRLSLRSEGAVFWAREGTDMERSADVGVLFAPGVSVTATEYLDATAMALLGGSYGFEVGARGHLDVLPIPIRPTATLSMPFFIEDGLNPGVRGTVGALWTSRHVRVAGDVGLSYALRVPDRFIRTVLVASLTVEVGL